MSNLRNTTIPLAFVFLSACAVIPERSGVGVDLPVQFAQPGEVTTPAAWWNAFPEPELETLMQQAFRDNPGLAVVQARLRAADASLRGSRADLFPSLNLSATATDGFADSTAEAVSQVGLAAAYELDLWARLRHLRGADLLEAQATAQDVETARMTLASSVATLWFQIGAARERLTLIQSDRQNYEITLKLIELRFRQGLLSAGNVLQQRQLLESTRSSEAAASSELAQLRNALGEILGGDWRDDWSGASDWQVPALPRTGVPAETVMNRPDVQQAWLRVMAADHDVAAAIAARFPQLELSVSYSSTDAGVLQLFDQWIGSLTASLLGPVFDGGGRRAEVDRQRAVLDQRVAEFREQTLVAFREIQDALAAERALQKQVASLEQQQALADAAVQSLLVQLRNGTSDFPSLLGAQVDFSAVKRELLTARQQRIENRISLYRALAGALPAAQNDNNA